MRNYTIEGQKGTVIQIMIKKGYKNWYEDFELEKCGKLFVGNNAGRRLSQLLKDGVVEVQYFDNPKAIKPGMAKKARYRLLPARAMHYTELYNVKPLLFNMF